MSSSDDKPSASEVTDHKITFWNFSSVFYNYRYVQNMPKKTEHVTLTTKPKH